MVNIWGGYVGIFEDKGSWVAGGDPDVIDLDDFTAEGDDYILLNVMGENGGYNPDLVIKSLPSNLTGSFGIGKNTVNETLNCWVKRNSTTTEKEKYALISQFINGHMTISDPAVYLVKRSDLGGTWKYEQWPNSSGTLKKYLKCKVGPARYQQNKFGLRKFNLEITQTEL